MNNRFFAILALAILAVAAISVNISTVEAVDVQATYAFIVVNPNPAGLRQDVFVFFFLSNLQASAGGTGGARFTGYTVNMTRPDGTTETRGPFTADPVSSAYFTFQPDQLGNYTFKFIYPGETTPATTGPGGSSPETTFLPSESETITLTVQQDPLPIMTGNPAPTGYWNRPISGQNYLWGGVSNNWLMASWDGIGRQFDQGSVYIPVGDGPDSAHVLWTRPLTFGGAVGGEFGAAQFTDGRSYEQFFKPPVVISGRLYYNSIIGNEPVTSVNNSHIVAVDMKDGKTLFTIPNATLSFGQIYNYVSPNQAGALAYLWEARGSTWRMFDAWTGQYILTLANVPSGFGTVTLLSNTFYGNTPTGPGDIMVYAVNAQQRTLTVWNSSKAIPKLGDTGTNFWQWRPVNYMGLTLNATGNTTIAGVSRSTNGIQLVANLTDFPTGASMIQVGHDNKVYVANGTAVVGTIFAMPYIRTFCAYSMTDGSKIWGPTTIDFGSQIPQNATLYYSSAISAYRQIGPDDILPLWCKEVGAYFAWNIRTGQFLWGPSETVSNGWVLYNWESKLLTPDGYLYNWGYDGVIHAFNLTTGASLWQYSTGDAGLNTPYGTWPIYNGITIIDGKIYLQTSDHGNGVTPLYQGEALHVLDYKTGQPIFNITGWWEQPVIVDGRYVSHNCYDNQIHCIGKGPSRITFTATPAIQTLGSGVLIQGYAEDISPGAKQKVADGEFNMIPLIADEDQGRYMNYIYQQQEIPGDARGVTIRLTALDPNGNPVDIGTTTTDLSGMFKFVWTGASLTGAYTITASFDGSDSYWPSYAQAAVGIASAEGVITTPTPTATTPGPTVTPGATSPAPTGTVGPSPSVAPPPEGGVPIALYAGIAAAIIIVAIVAAAIILRRH